MPDIEREKTQLMKPTPPVAERPAALADLFNRLRLRVLSAAQGPA